VQRTWLPSQAGVGSWTQPTTESSKPLGFNNPRMPWKDLHKRLSDREEPASSGAEGPSGLSPNCSERGTSERDIGRSGKTGPWKDLHKRLSDREEPASSGAEGPSGLSPNCSERGTSERDIGRSGKTGPWKDLHKRLSDLRPSGQPQNADGGDSPAWSAKRSAYVAPKTSFRSPDRSHPYAELHAHSNFSFLDGASHPEDLAEEAMRLGLNALALTDHNGFYGVVRFAEAANAIGLPTVFGSELTLEATRSSTATPDPEGRHLVVLARGPDGYARLARAITEAQMRGKKNHPRCRLEQLEGGHDDWLVLTGCRKGLVPQTLTQQGERAALEVLDQLKQQFGGRNVAVELWDHGSPLDAERNTSMAALANELGLLTVVTNNVHYARPIDARLGNVVAAIRARKNLDDMRGWLPTSGLAHLRSGVEQAQRFEAFPGAVDRAAEYGVECAFDLRLVAPKLPDFPVPEGHTEMSWLRELTELGARKRYGLRDNERVPGAYHQIDYELEIIENLGFPGYFLIVWDIVEFCNRNNIYCQGRGSAANSAVCYATGITKTDAVSLKLLFERFLSPERDGPPDIDLDIESGRREEVIQYVYQRYGRTKAAQVANVIAYRPKLAVRDAGRALGYAPGQLDVWSTQLHHWGAVDEMVREENIPIPGDVVEIATKLAEFPRHLGIHSGGMVLCDRPVIEVCPVEWATKENRSVLQWDKEDCAATGLVKFDLLGLGMLEALHRMVDLIEGHDGTQLDLATIPQDDKVYEMLQRADTVGVFQVESRAQMATLPRLKPRTFYDLVVEVALIRPGPIQGGSVHPYIRRRNGLEPVTYLHPLLENSLKKTLGVPLFQEQLMQMAIDVAGFSASEADQLRQAVGSKRSLQRMERLKQRLYEGMAERGITGKIANEIFEKLKAFASFGFPESHSVSFAYLVYASSYIKCHYPAAFLAALLNSQPMGFWSPSTLISDAQRHGVVVHKADVNNSKTQASLRKDGSVQLGLSSIRYISDECAERVTNLQPFTDLQDFARRTEVSERILESLATAGAFRCFGVERREALWAAGALSQVDSARLPGIVVGVEAPQLPLMTPLEETVADLWATNVSPDRHLIEFARPYLRSLGAVPADELSRKRDRQPIVIGGIVTHRQRPATASGITFMSIEDETGLMNVVVTQKVWRECRDVAMGAPAIIIRGHLESANNVINIVASSMEELPVSYAVKARNFH
jgi:error-prone DNA polymerase